MVQTIGFSVLAIEKNCNAGFTLHALAEREQSRSSAYGEQEQHTAVLLSHWQRHSSVTAAASQQQLQSVFSLLKADRRTISNNET